MKLFYGAGATVIVGMMRFCYAVVEVSVSGKESCKCIIDLKRDVMYPWKIKDRLVGLVIGWRIGWLRI